jgi:hypothetical protein
LGQTFVESLRGLSGRQWIVILSLLICANLIVYGVAGWLLVQYVLRPPPAPEIERTPAPTLRPTFTPTWTVTPVHTPALLPAGTLPPTAPASQ